MGRPQAWGGRVLGLATPQPPRPSLGLTFPICVMEREWGTQGTGWGGRPGAQTWVVEAGPMSPPCQRPAGQLHSCSDLWWPGRPRFSPCLRGVGPAGGPSRGHAPAWAASTAPAPSSFPLPARPPALCAPLGPFIHDSQPGPVSCLSARLERRGFCLFCFQCLKWG